MMPTELIQGKNFVLWRLEDKNKVPYQLNGKRASSTNSETWATFEECKQYIKTNTGQYDGIGIMLTRASPIICIDIDNCFPLNKKLDEFINSFNSFTELSQSRKGLHIYLKAPLGYIPSRNRGVLNGQEIELYSENRFIAMTGYNSKYHYNGYKELNTISLEQLKELEELIFPTNENHYKEITATRGLKEANEVINKLLKAKNANKFKRLYSGDITGYIGQSEARRALLWSCIFYTRDEQVLLEILESSALDKTKQCTRRSGIPFFEYEIKRALNTYKGCVYKNMIADTVNIISEIMQLSLGETTKRKENMMQVLKLISEAYYKDCINKNEANELYNTAYKFYNNLELKKISLEDFKELVQETKEPFFIIKNRSQQGELNE